MYFKIFPTNENITNNEFAHKPFGVLWYKERCAHELAIAWFGDYKGERPKDG